MVNIPAVPALSIVDAPDLVSQLETADPHLWAAVVDLSGELGRSQASLILDALAGLDLMQAYQAGRSALGRGPWTT